MKLIKANKVQAQKVNHQSSVTKKVFLGNADIPNLMMFSAATFKPNDKVDEHAHDTMYETFHIIQGDIDFKINNTIITLSKGDTITIEPNEIHSLKNNSNKITELIYFGISSNMM